MTEERPNFKYVGMGYYLVRTQAGVKAAYKAWLKKNEYEKDSYPYGDGAAFPQKFPSVVRFTIHYQGYSAVYPQFMHVNKFREQLAELNANLNEIDPQ